MKNLRYLFSLICCLLLILIVLPATAQSTKTWTGQNSRFWSDAGNWQPAGVPDSNDAVIVTNPASGNRPLLDGNHSVRKLNIRPGGSLTINGFRLTVLGDFTLEPSGIVTDHLVMAGSPDSLLINGNAVFASQTRLDSGKIFLRGDFDQNTVNIAFRPSVLELILDGDSSQSVYFERPGIDNKSFFGDVRIDNPAGVHFTTDVYVNGQLSLENNGKLTQASGFKTLYLNSLPVIQSPFYEVPKSRIADDLDLNKDWALPLNGNDLTVAARKTLNLNGHTLAVGGNLLIEAFADHEHLLMTNPSDSLLVDGNLIIEGDTMLDSGVVVIGGNLTQRVSSSALQANGTTFIFAGSSPQTVSFERPGISNRSFLGDVMISNEAGVTFLTEVYVTGKLELLAGSLTQSGNLNTFYTTALPVLEADDYFVPNSMVADTIELTSNIVLPRSDNNLTILQRQAIVLNGHTLDVGGDLTVNIFEDEKHLIMTDPADSLIVRGNATLQGQTILTAGTIVLHGDMSQEISSQTLQPSGTRIVFAGNSPQTVSFQKPGTATKSFFDDVMISNAAGVSFASDVYIAGQLELQNGSTLSQSGNFGIFYDSALPIIVDGRYLVANTRVNGAVVLNRDLMLAENFNNLTILPRKSLRLNGHTLFVGGNFHAGVFSSEKHLIMTSSNDRLIVGRDAKFEGLNTLEGGAIILHGNLDQEISAAAIQPAGTEFVFSGANPQIITFERPGVGNRSFLQSVTIDSGAVVKIITDLYVTGRLENRGSIEVIDTRTLFLRGDETTNHPGAVIKGNGRIDATATAFTNAGIVSPGSSVGILAFAGLYNQTSTGIFEVELNGLTPGINHDRLDLDNSAVLDGILRVSFGDSFAVSFGDSFRVMNYQSFSGSFDRIEGKLPKNVLVDIRYRPAGIDLITFEAPNVAPLAQSDSVTTPEDVALLFKPVANDSDANCDQLRLTSLDLTGTIGQASIAGDSTISYVPAKDFNGTDSFRYRVTDGRGGVDSAMVYVNVTPVNDAPELIGMIPDTTILEDSQAVIVFANLNTIFRDVDDPALTFQASAAMQLATEVAEDMLIVTPQPDFFGVVEVTVTAIDGENASASTSFQVTVENVNDAPTTFDLVKPADQQMVPSLERIDFAWRASSDVDQDDLTYGLRIFDASFDSTVTGIPDTSFIFVGTGVLRPATTYQWLVTVTDGQITTASSDTFELVTPPISSVKGQDSQVPAEFGLSQNYPNPFNPSTTIDYALPKPLHVTLKIYTTWGQEVRTLLDEEVAAGYRTVVWDGRNDANDRVASGMYLYKIIAGDYVGTRQMIFLK